ncbi:MAG: DUF5041 domain-containing protein [Bacteroidaceae bacterium]|nr:DUF5041 domain-containing protein [Bacteroidaceae bacterium]
MKKTILIAILALTALTGQAQEIRTSEPTLDDYLQLLNAKGYIAYSFDTQDFKGKSVEPVVMEYVKGKEARDVLGFSFSFPIGEKLVIGLAPSSNDSTYVYSYQSVGGGGFNSTLKLLPVYAPEMPTKQAYRYESRPFELVSPVETRKFIPLVLFGSYWYEPETGVSRFCGEKLIKHNFSSEITKSIPHFYVLGIKIK